MYQKPNAPLSAGGVIDDASKLYRAAFRRCAPIAVLGALVSVAFELFIVGYSQHAGLPLTGLDALLKTYQEPPVMALSLLQTVILLALFGAMILTMNAAASAEARLSVGRALRLGFSRLGRCVIAALVSSVMIVLGLLLLLVPGIYLSGALALWPVALYVDDAGGLQSLDVSRKMIHGHWWHASAALGIAVLIVLAFSLIAGFVAGVVELTISGEAGESLVQFISAAADVIMLPMLPAALVALYNDLKLRQRRVTAAQGTGPTP
ncbi:MAG: YciC family protein [Steroidobacterales bacterium]